MQARFAALAAEIGDGREPAEVADGFIRIAIENMANAIKTISVQRGYDVADYVLNTFGGAGGQHACLVADALGLKRVLIHPLSGVLSAYGMGLAELKATRSQAVLRRLDADGLAAAEALAAPLAADATEELVGQGVPSAASACRARRISAISAPTAHCQCHWQGGATGSIPPLDGEGGEAAGRAGWGERLPAPHPTGVAGRPPTEGRH